jgi:ribonuclease D
MAAEPLSSSDARLARLKELRRDVVRSLGTIFFQHLPDDLLQRLIENPPKTVLELRDDFELHARVIENFGTRILHLLNAGSTHTPPRSPRFSQESPTPQPVFPSPRHQEERAPRAKVAASQKVAGGKVGALHGRAVEQRFERLRTLRLDLARKNRWPAFCVLQDETLLEIARAQPRNMRELLEIKGMGPKRAERYGKELLAEIAKE